MHRITDQHHTAFEPGLGHQQGFQRAKDDAGGLGDVFPSLGHQWCAEVCQQFAHQAGEVFGVHMFVQRAVLGDEHVHLVLGHRVHTRLGAGAHPHHGALHFGRTRQHRAPDGLACVFRFRGVGEDGLPGLGIQAVGTDHQVVAGAATVGQAHRHAFGILFDRLKACAQMDLRPAGTGSFCHQARQCWSHDRATPRGVGSGKAWRRQFADRLAVAQK